MLVRDIPSTDVFADQTIVVPAKPGTHFSTGSGADRWVPGFAGTTHYFV